MTIKIFGLDSKFKTVWNIIIILLLAYTATLVPYKVAFIDDSTLADTIIDTTVDILFIMDIFVNFFSAIEDSEGKAIGDCKTIAVTYIKGWFFLDLIAW